MFSGQFSKRKQVNLGGQSKTVDRASALAEARREREQRSRERARASAAVLLQVRDSALARSLTRVHLTHLPNHTMYVNLCISSGMVSTCSSRARG